ncbi:uncharacterized protein G2W53_027826 [Senna tora]|uniref:Uncharacterized protein n=1 Tax=Senna tora TaxID=362788 RepID=A0A834TKB9_9FABA|nr:uncharacterized protein G2W53_027826 [Senna tora]
MRCRIRIGKWKPDVREGQCVVDMGLEGRGHSVQWCGPHMTTYE